MRIALRLVPGALALLQLGCSACDETPEETASESVVFLGIDGLDPRLLRGLLRDSPDDFPHLLRLSEEGFFIDLKVSRTPILSPILWASMSTGYTEKNHGIQSWTANRQAPVSQTDLYASRFWEAGSEQGRSVLQVGSLMTSPVVPLNGVNVGDVFSWSYLNDGANLSSHVYPEDRVESFSALVPGPTWMQESPYVGNQLTYIEARHHPMLADESFLRIFESTWPTQHFDIGVLYLKGIDRVGHMADPTAKVGSMGFTALRFDSYFDVGPDWIKDQYLYMDSAVGRVLELLDPETTTLVLASDHGWDVHSETPEWETRHRDPGLLMGWGKRAHVATSKEGIGQLDLGSTLYALVGLGVAQDTQGVVQSELFDLPDSATPVESYILSAPLDPANGAAVSEQEKRDRLEQLQSLGYLDPLGDEREDKQRAQ